MLQATTLRQALTELGNLIVELMREYLETRGRFPLKRGRSNLLDSMRAEVVQPRDGSGRFSGFDASALRVYVAEYAQYVERGRRPGAKKVPISALIAWIKARRVGIGRTTRGRFTARTVTVTQLAFAIQAAIYKRGIAGRPFIQAAFNEGQKAFDAWLDTRALTIITADLDRAFNLKPA